MYDKGQMNENVADILAHIVFQRLTLLRPSAIHDLRISCTRSAGLYTLDNRDRVWAKMVWR
jgi:hypothetical protein